jgi:hypothetical protein
MTIRKSLISLKNKRLQLILLISICLICPLSLLLFENIPRFIALPITPPADYYGSGMWINLTYSTRIESIGRVFMWRREGMVSNGDHGNQSWDSIVTYFDDRLKMHGWLRDENYAPCNIYLPESKFLNSGQNGYVHYRRAGYIVSPDSFQEDLICLAVWVDDSNQDGLPGNFYIVILTARPSWLLMMVDRLF